MASLECDVAAFETWLRKHCAVLESDLQSKHDRLRRSAFDFLRCTYFRWARTIESLCPDLRDAPRAACVGDIHLKNFRIRRAADARLVWGVNDFDEAADWLRPFANAGVAALREFGLELEDYPRASPPEDLVRPLRKSLPKGAASAGRDPWPCDAI